MGSEPSSWLPQAGYLHLGYPSPDTFTLATPFRIPPPWLPISGYLLLGRHSAAISPLLRISPTFSDSYFVNPHPAKLFQQAIQQIFSRPYQTFQYVRNVHTDLHNLQ
jgi:hypothetical protein